MSNKIDIERNDAEIEDEKEEQSPFRISCIILVGLLVVLTICLAAVIYFIAFFSSPEVKNPPRCGKDWVPGVLQPKVQSGKFLIYGVNATIEDSKKECESQNSKLVTIDSISKLFEVQEALMGNDSKHFYGINDMFWTGGYIDAFNGKTNEIKWHGSPNKTTPFDDYDRFVGFLSHQLDRAIANLNKTMESTSKDHLIGDCGSHDYIYLRLYHPSKYKETGRIYGLTILNFDGRLNQDCSKFVIVCEKNDG